MVKFPVDDAEKFAIWMLQDFDVNGETVMIAPGNGFYATPGKGVDEARLAYVLNCEDLEKAMALLAEAVKHFQYTGMDMDSFRETYRDRAEKEVIM